MLKLRHIFMLLVLLAPLPCFSQHKQNVRFQLLESTLSDFSFRLEVSDFKIVEKEDYCRIEVGKGFVPSNDVGCPELPQYYLIIAVPEGATPLVHYTSSSTITRQLGEKKLFPAQPHLFKKQETNSLSRDEKVYSSRQFYAKDLVSASQLGVAGAVRLWRIAISPFAYDPANNVISLQSEVLVEIRFEGADLNATRYQLQARNGIPHYLNLTNRRAFEKLLNQLSTTPPKYLVVAQDTFGRALRPFVEWKRQQGFDVIELYTSDTCTVIRSKLDSIYKASTPVDPAPAYLLLVGDVSTLGTFRGTITVPTIGRHHTDLYYAEYTGDFYPEIPYGRLSVADTAELTAVIDKIIHYEQFSFADTSYLNRVVLVAGRESRNPAPTVTNGQVNYLRNNYLSQNPSLDTHYYYNPESQTRMPQIFSQIRQGVSLLNYSSHCVSSGWQNPDFRIGNADTLGNFGKYFFAVNNCCLSNRFVDSLCFGEKLLRLPNAGAVSVIGAANETLWDEDFYWSVGAKYPFSLNPGYDSTTLGAFDRLIHSHGEAHTNWAPTAGQMLMAGNMSLAQVGSPYENYYWEIYNLIGDPSLMPYIGVPQRLVLNFPDSIPVGTNHVQLSGTPYARVAFMQDSVLLASILLDSNGNATATFVHPANTGDITITATAQFFKTLIDTIKVFADTTPKAVITSFSVVDTVSSQLKNTTLDAGSTYFFNATVANVAADTAFNVVVRLLSQDTLCQVTTSPDSISSLAGMDTVTLEPAALFSIDRATPNGSVIVLKAVITVDDSVTYEVELPYMVQSLELELDAPVIVYNGIRLSQLNQGDTCEILLPVTNKGMLLSDSVKVTLVTDSVQASVISANNVILPPIAPQNTDTAQFKIVISPNVTGYVRAIIGLAHLRTEAYSDVVLPVGMAKETFETGDFTLLPWDTTHPNAWLLDTAASSVFAGRFSAKSYPIRARQQSIIQLPITTIADDSISFFLRTSTEQGYDYLSFYIDGVRQNQWSGNTGWKRVAFFVAQGTHVFRWQYEKDDTGDSGSDCVWIDNITLPLCLLDTAYNHQPDVDIYNVRLNKPFRVYPNPAKDHFVVENLLDEPVTVSLTNSFGVVVEKFMLNKGESTYYFTSKSRCGIYILSIIGGNANCFEKIIISE